MTDDLVPSISGTNQGMPAGQSLVHDHPQSLMVWRLCCRIRLDMRETGLSLKDAHSALFMAFPDLKIKQQDLKHFMEVYVDPAVIVEPSFWKKGLMQAKGKLNAVVEASNIAQKMHDAFDDVELDPENPQKYMLAGERAMKARERQYEMMRKVGFGSEVKEQAPATVVAPQIRVENAQFNLGGILGGSFARRAAHPVIDVEPKPSSGAGSGTAEDSHSNQP